MPAFSYRGGAGLRNPCAQHRDDVVRRLDDDEIGEEFRRIDGVFRRGIRRCDGTFDRQVSDGGTAQFGNDRSCSEFRSDIPGERADVRACRNLRRERGGREFE